MKFEQDHYTVLGITRNATIEEIKKAYRKLARLNHPDHNPEDKNAEQRFKNINFAYETLSSPTKRRDFDLRTPAQSKARNKQPDPKPRSSSRPSYSGNRTYTGSSNSRSGPKAPTRGSDATANEVLNLTIKEALLGCTKTHYVRGPVDNPGRYRVNLTLEPAIKFKPKKIKGKGHISRNGGESGDLIFNIQIKNHAIYSIKGADLSFTLRVSAFEALLGAEIELSHLLGGNFVIKVPRNSKNGSTIRLKGLGAPKTSTSNTGDLIVKLKVVEPSLITEKAKDLMHALDKELFQGQIRNDYKKHINK